MDISFIHTQIVVHLYVNKTNWPHERLRTTIRFETEAKGISEITNYQLQLIKSSG